MLRRNFIRLTATGAASIIFNRLTYAAAPGASLIGHADEAWVVVNDKWIQLSKSGTGFNFKDLCISFKTTGNGQSVYVQAPEQELQAVKLRWNYDTARYTKILGDHYERSYGDLAWKPAGAVVKNPWYALLFDGSQTACFGVKTGCNAICYWQTKGNALELTLDTHSGGVGVKLGRRTLHAADLVTMLSHTAETPYAAATRFCKVMCSKPRLPKQPVYGINDWYVVYGNNSYETIRAQTQAMAELVTDHTNQPFSVIDDGWQQPDDFSIVNDKFKDMHKMADEIKRLGMRPGLWTRPLIARLDDRPNMIAPKISGRDDDKAPILDPTLPETIERVKRNMSLYKQWGHHMVKHDYSTYDIFGKWGMRMNDGFTQPGWKYNDQTKTNAEIINNLYRAIRESAGDMYIIGCNTMSHLSAGLFELNRIGDDTSGKEWARTKKMGVNTLGFRMPQNYTFYAADGDCVGITKDVAWEKSKLWLQLVAESGSPLFISAEIGILDADRKTAIKTAFAQAAKVQPNGEPLDWLTNPFPSKWKLNNREVNFNWD